MIFFANVSRIRGPSFSKRRMFRIFGYPDAILSECFECCFENRRMSRAKSLSIAEFCECIRNWHPTSLGCESLKHSQNSAIDKDFARDIRRFSKQHSKHSLKIASRWPKIQNIRLSEKFGPRIFETFAKNIIRSSKKTIYSCPRNV